MSKYGSLHLSLIDRINQEEQHAKNPDKAVKTRLHQLYGAYVHPNSNKKASALINQLAGAEGAGPEHTAAKLLGLHASTKERLPFYEDFYDFIFDHSGAVNKVLDLGCGFNPFSLPFFPQWPTEYHAVDIDIHTKDLLNIFFELLQLPKKAVCEDLATVNPQTQADLAMMLKLFPVLEANSPGRAYSLANGLDTTWLVVSFPTKSLGGKKRGMALNYKTSFLNAISQNSLNNFGLIAESLIGNELVFILRRHMI